MLSTIGIIIMVLFGSHTAFTLLKWLMYLSGTWGAKLSKKVGTDNEKTDEYIEQGKEETKKVWGELAISLFIMAIGLVLYLLGT